MIDKILGILKTGLNINSFVTAVYYLCIACAVTVQIQQEASIT